MRQIEIIEVYAEAPGVPLAAPCPGDTAVSFSAQDLPGSGGRQC